jgi:hypothetical protein
MPSVADPVRLSFMKPICFYCHEPMKGTVQIEMYFGIHFCEKHKNDAERDCNAYLHQNGLVPMNRLHDFPALVRFVEVLERTPFKLQTKDGLVGGWNVDHGYSGRETYLRYNRTKDAWTILLYREDDRDSGKTVSIRDFLEPIVINPFPKDICEIVNDIDVLLRKGVYKNCYISQRNNA